MHRENFTGVLVEKFGSEIQRLLSKYPPDQARSGVMPLLFLAQREFGYLDRQAIEEVARLVGISPTEVASLVGFYTLYHEAPGGKHRLQVCTDLPCALRGGETFAEALCENLGLRLGETTPDGLVTVEEVMCLAACDKAPVFQRQSPDGLHYHEEQSVESALALIETLRGEGSGD